MHILALHCLLNLMENTITKGSKLRMTILWTRHGVILISGCLAYDLVLEFLLNVLVRFSTLLSDTEIFTSRRCSQTEKLNNVPCKRGIETFG